MILTRPKFHAFRPKVYQTIGLTLLIVGTSQGQEKKAPNPLVADFASWQIARWITDCKNLEFNHVADGEKGKWCFFSFSPSHPGQTVVEERAVRDEKTGGYRVLPETDTKPLVKGTYGVVKELGGKPQEGKGRYRFEATFGLSGFYSGPDISLKYLKGDPRFIGGNGLARFDEHQGVISFDHVLGIPSQWVNYVKPIFQEYNSVDTPVQGRLEDQNWLLGRLKSFNPLWHIIAVRQLLKKSKLDEPQIDRIENQFLTHSGLEKAVIASLMIDSDRETNRFSNFIHVDTAKSITAKMSSQDIYFLLHALLVSGVQRVYDPFTGIEDSRFGPSLLRVLATKVATTDDNAPFEAENKKMLKSFILVPSTIPPEPDQN